MEKYEESVRKILSNIFNQDLSEFGIKKDLQYIGMDSLNCMNIIIALEDGFKITIPEEKLGLRYIRNIYDICKLIKEVKE
ncbi:MAG: phosphopantetheine-binding protein [Bacillota bacterium]|nr:phosphopantetheine-binding protein [Bacillota bacterium]